MCVRDYTDQLLVSLAQRPCSCAITHWRGPYYSFLRLGMGEYP